VRGRIRSASGVVPVPKSIGKGCDIPLLNIGPDETLRNGTVAGFRIPLFRAGPPSAYLWDMSMRRTIPQMSLLAVLLLSTPMYLSAQRKKKAAPPPPQVGGIDYKSTGAPIPQIRAVYPGKAVYTNKDVQNGANLFVMLFNPTCEHCEEMTLSFEKNIGLFKRSNILLMAAPGMGDYLEFFQNNTHVNEFPAIRVALDSSDFIQKTFRYESLPQVNVYSPDGKLLRSLSGVTKLDSLKGYIQ
jgi:hypothetical protein